MTRFRKLSCLSALLALATVGPASLAAALLPTGFAESLVVTDLDSPTAIEALPDGRILVAQQGGRVLLVPAEGGPATQILSLPTINAQAERGLLGVVAHPSFADNGQFYLYYSTNQGGLHERISRFRLEGNEVVGGETVLVDFAVYEDAIYHAGGAMRFGHDDTLYVGVGDHLQQETPQDLGSAFGKIHRFLPDGGIPADNPFAGGGGGRLPSIWAYGLRNPYSLEIDAATGELYINDVGESTWEEINIGVAGGDYGWPDSEGAAVGPGEEGPVYAYRHTQGRCAITGGASYPAGGSFPSTYWGKYFFTDFCAGWVQTLARPGGDVAGFASGLEFPTALEIDAQGRLLYLVRGVESGSGNNTGKLFRISYSADPNLLPQIVEPPVDAIAAVGEGATFAVTASGATAYQWQRDGVNLAGENQTTLLVENVALADDGARFRVVVSNSFGSVPSPEAVLTVTTNRAPVVTIATPEAGTGYAVGEILTLSGTAIDPEEGAVAADRLVWQIDLHHDAHVHPLMAATPGAAELLYEVPAEAAHGDGLVWLEVSLTATDLEGRSGRREVHIFPQPALAGEEPTILALRGGEYLVSLEFENPHSGLPESARALPQTADSGGFWFFAPANLEVLLKILDGTGFNDSYWIFFGSLSDVAFEFLVVETNSGRLRSYSNPAGTQASFGDIEAFPQGASERLRAAPPASRDASRLPGAANLDLLGGRFRLSVTWHDPWNGGAGQATAHPFTDQSGFFSFFAEDNLEMAVKMVDGSDFNGYFWLYWTALSNLETHLLVEDLWTDRVRLFSKPGALFGAGADIEAFPFD